LELTNMSEKKLTNEDFVAGARAMSSGHAAKLAIDKARTPPPRYQPRFTVKRRGAPVSIAPAEGAIVYFECHDDDAPRTLLTPAVADLVCEKVLGIACFATEREHADGWMDWDVESYPFTMHGVVDEYFAIVWPDGCVEYGEDVFQTNDERLAILRARAAFETSLKK
jgi:hypothetical protein